MSEDTPSQTITRSTESDRVLTVVNYVLFLVTPATIGLTSVIAVIMAYIRRDNSEGWITSHYTYQIHTFWYGFAFYIAGWLTVWMLGLGLLVWAAGTIWVVIRAIVGLMRVVDGRPNPDPTGFWV